MDLYWDGENINKALIRDLAKVDESFVLYLG
jgi:hypothetical protein